MAVYKKNKRAYSIGQPFADVFVSPIISSRAPTTKDQSEIGSIWVYQNASGTDDVFILSSVAANSANWVASGGGNGNFDTLTVSGNSTLAGTITLSALTAGTVRSSSAGLFSVLADGADGTILIGTTGGAAAWSTLTAGGGITITEAAGAITISNPGVTGTTSGTDVGGPVSPTGGGLTTFTGVGANLSTDGATANTVKIILADDIVSVASITATNDLTMSAGTLTVTSNDNSNASIYIHADAGVNERIRLHADQGTAVDSINLLSDVGGLTFASGLATADAININASDTAGGIDIDYGTSGMTVDGANGAFTLQTGTGNILLGTDVADHDVTIGDNSGVNAMSLVAGTGNLIAASEDELTLDAVGVLEFNSSAGIISIANDNVNQNVNLGTNGVRTISIGNSNGATAVDIDCGTGNLTLGTNATAHVSTLGSTNTTSATTIQAGSGAVTVTAGGLFDVNAVGAVTIDSTGGTLGLGEGADNFSVNISTAGARVTTIGNITGVSSVVLNVGTGNLDLAVGATNHTTRLGSTSGTCDTTIQAGTGAMTFTAGGIFDVNATGAVTIDGTTHTITSSADSAQAIYLHSNGGVTETIEVVNTQGTDAAAIALTATAGGVVVTASAITLDSAGIIDVPVATDSQAGAATTVNANAGLSTHTGLTTAAAAKQTLTITNSLCTAGSAILASASNLGANDAKINIERITPGAGSFTVDVINSGAASLNGDLLLTFWILAV